MKHTSIISHCTLLFALFLSITACGQQGKSLAQQDKSDSTALVNARWDIDTIDGLVLKTVQFSHHELFNANQYIAILEIPLHSQYQLAFTYEPRRTPTSTHAIRHNAIAAINGTFFDMDLHNPICYLRINGKEVGVNTPGSDTVNRKYYQYGAMALHKGRPYIFHTDSARMWERSLPDSNLMTAGPLLLLDGKMQPLRDDRTFVTQRHNRTAIGVKDDSTVILFVVDGRMAESAGMSLSELEKTLSWLGCCDALNLDGGGSTTMYVRNQPHAGIVNHPTDNGQYDFVGERGVSNCVMVIKK